MREGPFMDFNIAPSKARGTLGREKSHSKTQIIMPFLRLMSVWKDTIYGPQSGRFPTHLDSGLL
jgi:hypothetical protein